MPSTRAKQKATEIASKEMTPQVEGPIRQSSRRTLAPKRLMYSPGEEMAETPTKKGTKEPYNEAKIQKKKVNSKKNKVNSKEDSDENSDVDRTHCRVPSEYELERMENIRRNKAFLSSLDLFQTAEELKRSSRPKPSQRGLMRSQPATSEALPTRRSLRLQNKEAEVLTLSTEPRRTLVYEQPSKKPPGPLPMVPRNMDKGTKLPSELAELCSERLTEDVKPKLHLKEYCSALSRMRITEDRVAKVVKDRIFSAAFHPCNSHLIMAAGDKLGQVGLWSLDSDWGSDGVLLFEPHTSPVACMSFSRAHPTQLLSLSYDGSLRCMDLEKAVFDDVYDIDVGLKTFSFMSDDCLSLLIGTLFGQVAIVDRRTPGNTHESLHTLDKVVRCVSVHPLQKQYFAAAENKVVSIYDSRYLKKTKARPVSQLHGHSRSISSAYFSPCTGNRVLTSCMDNNIRIYDTSALTTETPLLKSIRHDMNTGRWLTKLSAMWDPKQEDCFVVGSMAWPRRVQVFHENGQLQHTFQDENVSTVLSITMFHPTRNALLGGNSSGRLHVFSN